MTDESHPEDATGFEASQVRAVSHGEMNSAYLSGMAVPLAQSVSWLVRYQGSWWVVYERGWLRITEDLVEADIDACASQLADTAGGAAREAHVQETDWRPVSGETDE